jgi:thiol-disulfide isomerase/thioredoxin
MELLSGIRPLIAAGLISFLLAQQALAAQPNLPQDAFSALKHLDGSALDAPKERRLLYFWATWCPTCIQKLRQGFSGLDTSQIDLIAINTDTDLARVQHVIEAQGIKVNVAKDGGVTTLKSLLNLQAVPSWAALERDASGTWKVLDAASGADQARMAAAFTR